jgi:hypothetical protein
MTDIAPILSVSIQRVSQIIAERDDFPESGDGDRPTSLVAA